HTRCYRDWSSDVCSSDLQRHDRARTTSFQLLRYVRNELVRRRARTIVTLVGLGIGVALVIALASLSNGLDRAQKQTLDPLGDVRSEERREGKGATAAEPD